MFSYLAFVLAEHPTYSGFVSQVYCYSCPASWKPRLRGLCLWLSGGWFSLVRWVCWMLKSLLREKCFHEADFAHVINTSADVFGVPIDSSHNLDTDQFLWLLHTTKVELSQMVGVVCIIHAWVWLSERRTWVCVRDISRNIYCLQTWFNKLVKDVS